MIRFRHEDDERKANLLRAEIYRLVAQHLPAALVSDVLRNLSKIETMYHLEGLRQGLAIAALTEADGGFEMPAPLQQARLLQPHQAHASVYGSQDTPLLSVESEWLKRVYGDAGEQARRDPWLDDSAMRFAGSPIGTAPARQEIVERLTVHGPPPASLQPVDGPIDLPPEVKALLAPEHHELPEAPEGTPEHQPALVAQIRDAMIPMLRQGWKPESWPDLVMKLHVTMAIDAGVIDLVLASPEGRAVLDQCGLFTMQPGHMVDMGTFQTEGPR